MADFLDAKRNEISARLLELKPLVDEYERLKAAVAALEGVPAAATDTASSRPASTRGAKRPRRDVHDATAAKRRGRSKRSNTRANEALELVKANPGITIAQLAEKMGIKQNYLYRVLPALKQDDLVTKQGRGWHPKQAT